MAKYGVFARFWGVFWQKNPNFNPSRHQLEFEKSQVNYINDPNIIKILNDFKVIG